MNKPTIILSVLVVALGVALGIEAKSAADLRLKLAEKEARFAAELADAQKQIAAMKEKTEIFKSESSQLRKRLGEKTGESADDGKIAVAGETATATPGGKQGGWMKGIAKMFKDPEMKKMMRAQQGMGVRMMYGDLAKDLHLTPDMAAQVMDLLTDRQMEASAKALNATGGEGTDAGTAIADAQKAVNDYDAKLKEVLGTDGMKKLNEYERTMGDRMMMQQYTSNFNAAGQSLDDQQRQGLLEIMKDERLKQPPTALEPGNKDVAATMNALQSGEGIDQALQSQRDLNQRVLARARTVLTPDQMVTFEAAQKQQMDMQEMGMKMGKAMMGGDGSTGGTVQFKVAPAAPVK